MGVGRLTALGALLPDDPTGPPQLNGGGVPPATGPAGISQEALSALMAREKEQGRRSATSDLLGQLGVASLDELKATLTRARDAEQAALSETQRQQQAAEQARQAAEAATSAALAQALQHRVTVALLKAGVPATDPADPVKDNPALGYAAKMVDVAPGADDAALAAAVASVKQAVPALFATPALPPGSDPGRPPAPGQAPAGSSLVETALAEAQRVHGDRIRAVS